MGRLGQGGLGGEKLVKLVELTGCERRWLDHRLCWRGLRWSRLGLGRLGLGSLGQGRLGSEKLVKLIKLAGKR